MARTESTFISQRDYVKDGGNHCPVCGGDNISASETNYSGSIMWQEVRCVDCEARWNDLYELRSYEILEHPTLKEPA
jgi:C4-type Zn-finger protein